MSAERPIQPHHDAPPCAACSAGSLVPPDGSGTHPRDAVHLRRLRCVACGAWDEPDIATDDGLRRLLQAWWSAGAWEGVQHGEVNS